MCACVYSLHMYVRGRFARVFFLCHVGPGEQTQVVGLGGKCPPHLYFVETRSISEPEVHQLGKAGWPVNLSDLPVSTPPPRSGFHTGSRHLNSGPPACVPDMLLTEPCLSSFMWDFCLHPTSRSFWVPSLLKAAAD